MSLIREKLASQDIRERLLVTIILFFLLFFGIVIISYFLLPEELLKNKNPLQSWETSPSTLTLTFQIFFYNMLSVAVIILGSLFAQKKTHQANYLSIGYLAFFTMISLNAVTLGTWSFAIDRPVIPLLSRIIGTFDIFHRAGLWEMMGQLLITCSVAHIAIVSTSGKMTTTKKISTVRLTKRETMVLILGFILMVIGAIVESIAINTQ